MKESTPPQGSGLSVPIDLPDYESPNSALSAKKARLSLQQPSSSGSSATSRPPGTLWAFFTRSTAKQNKAPRGRPGGLGPRYSRTALATGLGAKVVAEGARIKMAHIQIWAKSYGNVTVA